VNATGDDGRLIAALKAGDEAAFAALVRMHHRALVRLARMFVPSDAVAEEVVQEVWIGVLNGIDRFEGRSSLKTWIFRIATNIAKTRGVRESRTVPFSSVGGDEEDGPVLDPSRFTTAPDTGWWAAAIAPWSRDAAQIAADAEAVSHIRAAIDELPANQRAVITMRDLDGLDADEVCSALGLSQVNQRVLLHRARSRVREALEQYFGPV
jgi:RNA polymerase sigma-70 factor, ECF subfamily